MTYRELPDGQCEHDALDQMLVDANESISVPLGLENRVTRAIGRSIAIRRVAAASSVALVALVASVLVQTLAGPANQIQPGGPQAGTNEGLTLSPDDIMPSVPVAHRTAIVYSNPDSKYFAQAIPTTKPNVTIVRLYRDLTPTRETEPALDNAGEDARDENTENIDQSADNPGAAGPSSESNETIIRSEV